MDSVAAEAGMLAARGLLRTATLTMLNPTGYHQRFTWPTKLPNQPTHWSRVVMLVLFQQGGAEICSL